MKWSFKLGRFLGIDVYIHFTFLLLLAVIGFAHWVPERSLADGLSGVLFFALLFLCVLLHEYGHALMARRFGVGTRDITLLPIGGVARLERIPDKPGQELWVALAGPAVNVVIALLLTSWLTLQNSWEPLSTLGIADGSMAERLLAVNIGLVIFNMLPAFPMDGGRVLRAVLAMRMDYAGATRIAANVGKVMAVIFAIYGIFNNPMLILIAFFVWSGASQEASMAQVRSVVSGALVRDAMVTNFQVVTPSTTLQEMAALMLSGAQRDYPVMKRETVIGMLTHDDLLRAMQEHALDAPIVTFMRADVPTVNEDDLLDEVLARETGNDHFTSPVLKNGILVGLLTEENLHEYYIIRDAHRNLNFTWNRGARVVRDRTI